MSIVNKQICKKCGKELKYYNKDRKKYYYLKTKSGLCKKCVSKQNYLNRGAFTHNKGRLYTKEEINLLTKEYADKSNEELANLLNRNKNSITHKANRLGLSKSLSFWNNHKVITSKMFSNKNNPMFNKDIKIKASNKLKDGYRNGKIKLSGAALQSHLGLRTKEKHPNWLGGISFEPYDKNFDKKFHKLIRQRDNNCCMICYKIIGEKIDKNLCVHHIDYNKKNTCKENCVLLCNSCHMKTNYNRSSWIKFFHTLMSDRYGYEY